MCPAAAIAVPAVVGALSSMFGAKSQKKQAAAAAKSAETARQESKAPLTPGAVQQSANWLFPGLLPSGGVGGYGGPSAGISTPPPRSGGSIYDAIQGYNPRYDRKSGVAAYLQQKTRAGSVLAPSGPSAPVSDTAALPIPRAAGGPISPKQPYLVGEQGPEIIRPDSAGQVIPAGPTAEMMGGEGGDDDMMAGAPDGDEKTQQLLQILIALLTHALGGAGGAATDPGGMGAPSGLEARATGGPVAAGGAYLTGEEGPETVVPTPGSTTPPAPTPPTPGAAPPVGTLAVSPGTQPTPAAVPGAGTATTSVATGPQAIDANGAPIQTGASIGGLAVGHVRNFLENPGQISSVGYERAQEQANQGLATGSRAVAGGLTASGIDPNTPMGQALMTAVAATAGKQRNEAARDYTLAEEAQRRADIGAATQTYINMLSTLFGYQGQQSAAAGSQPGVQVPVTSNPWQIAGNALTQYASGKANQRKSGGSPTNPVGADDDIYG